MDINGKSVCLVGYGASNQAMCSHLMKMGIFPTVRNDKEMRVPSGIRLVTDNYLETCEDVVFRSPVIRPDRIRGGGIILSESAYALAGTRGIKIGVTGSDGKTTTSTLIYKMLLAAGKNANLCGNIGTPIVDHMEDSTSDTYTVCELSSFQLFDMSPALDTAIITNITENHLDWHTDMREYIDSKRNILKSATHHVLNYDDDIVRGLSDGANVTYFTSQDMKDRRVSAAHLVHISDGAIYYDARRMLELGDIRLRGEFNISNFQCAIAAVYPYVDKAAIVSVARTFTGVENRMKCVETIGGVSFIDSSIDSTPSRTIATLGAFDKKKSIVILGGYDKCLSYAPLSCALADIKGVVLCGENAERINAAIKETITPMRASTLEDAVTLAYNIAESGDSVILSPASASFDMFKNYKEKAEKFKEIVKGLKWKS